MSAGHHSMMEAGVVYRFARMQIDAIKGGRIETQLSRVDLLDSALNVIPWPAEVTATANINGNACFEGLPSDRQTGRHTASEPPSMILDGSTSTKFCVVINNTFPVNIIIDLGAAGFDMSAAKWRWYTANDETGRDPKSFSFSISDDGSDWVVLDSAVNASITSSRNSVAYTGQLSLRGGGSL